MTETRRTQGVGGEKNPPNIAPEKQKKKKEKKVVDGRIKWSKGILKGWRNSQQISTEVEVVSG